MDIKVLYEDQCIAVVIKPSGVPSESPGMPKLVAERCSCREVFCVQRLDQPVSGLMVYAKTRAAASSLSFRHPASGEPLAFRVLPAPVFPWSSFHDIDSAPSNEI